MFCINCGKQNNDNAMFCSSCGNSLQQTLNYGGATMLKTKKKKGGKLALILIPIVVVLAALIAVGCLAFSKLNSPMVKISKGLLNLAAGDAYTYDIKYDDGYDTVNVSGDVRIDLKGKNIDASNIKLTVDGETGKGEIEAFLHTNDKEFGAIVIEPKYEDDVSYKECIYNGYDMYYEDGVLTEGFNLFEEFTDDPDKFNERMFEVISLLFDVVNGDAEVEALGKKAIDLVKDYYPDLEINENQKFEINSEIEEQVVKELKKCFTDEKWLKESLGLTVSKDGKTTEYTFDIPIGKALKAIYNIVEPLVKDVYDQLGVYLEAYDEDIDSFSSFVDAVMEEIDYLDEDYSVKAVIEVSDKIISGIHIEMEEDYSYETDEGTVSGTDKISIDISISKSESFKEPDVSEYKKDIGKVKKE